MSVVVTSPVTEISPPLMRGVLDGQIAVDVHLRDLEVPAVESTSPKFVPEPVTLALPCSSTAAASTVLPLSV